MLQIREVAFYLGVASLFTHELDAVPNHEWRGMPILSALPDETGMWVFIAAHVPLFAVLIAVVGSRHERVRTLSRVGVAAFLVLHGALHAASADDPGYEFASGLSRVLIFGGAALGALYLALPARRGGAAAER